MGEERTGPRERWLVVTWDRERLKWVIVEAFAHSAEAAARHNAALHVEELGDEKAVRLLHTSDSQI